MSSNNDRLVVFQFGDDFDFFASQGLTVNEVFVFLKTAR